MQITLRVWMALTTGLFLCGAMKAQDTQTQNPSPEPRAPQSEIRRAIRWKPFEYSCAGGEKVSVYLSDTLAKVLFQGHQYLLKQTASADGNRYSDGELVWWGKGEGGFLQEDTPDGDGKFLAKDCKLEKPTAGTGILSGTVAYRQRIALPPQAVIELQLRELPAGDARESTTLVANEKITMGDRQVPVPFTLRYDPGKINANRVYDVKARIIVGEQVRFSSGQVYPVLTQGNPSHVDMILDQVGTDAGGNEKP
jgi:putative lipoprotein